MTYPLALLSNVISVKILLCFWTFIIFFHTHLHSLGVGSLGEVRMKNLESYLTDILLCNLRVSVAFWKLRCSGDELDTIRGINNNATLVASLLHCDDWETLVIELTAVVYSPLCGQDTTTTENKNDGDKYLVNAELKTKGSAQEIFIGKNG